MKSALFIDFDNIYITLEQQDKQAAEKFASNPDRWLGWLERQLPMNYPGSDFTSRRILIRRCYLNPNSFSEYRPQFIRSACEVIDCPPLTAQGKTSTDIHMVMDMLDTLSHDTFFHEFIIFSGDADFTPVLLKIRKHARYSAVLSVGYSSPAYRAACDQLIKDSAFLETALGISYQDDEHEVENNVGANKVDKKLLKNMADRVHEGAMLPTGIPANDLPAIYKEFPGFKQSNHWLGYKSLRRLTQAIVELHKDLVILEDEDSWSVARKVFAGWLLSANEKDRNLQSDTSLIGLRDQVSTWVTNLVGASPTPIALNVLAQSVMRRFGDQEVASGWLGAGTFKNLLQQLDLEPLLLSSEGPSYLYDPNRHSFSADEQGEEEIVVEPTNQDVFSTQYAELAPLARKIHRLTDMPYLLPAHYAILFSEIAREVNERGYKMTRTSRTVRDQCIEHGAPIARSHVNFVLTGLYYIGHRLGSKGEETAKGLGEKMVENTINLCRTAQFELNPEEEALVRQWLLGEVTE
ncbi:MAG TPA: hypothetical protein DCX53_03115 [Anaerolineae bacterium]|nr:hypothetical protein [Anaerolineae bacterium]